MVRKLLTVFTLLFISTTLSFAQMGALKVVLKDKANNETIPFANIVVLLNGTQAGQGQTNIDGEAMIKPLTPGKYTVKATYVGYQTLEIRDVVVTSGTAYLDGRMTPSSVDLKTVEVVDYVVPLINPQTESSKTFSKEDIQHMATQNINSVAALTQGVFQDANGNLSFRGGRVENNIYYVDGIRMTSSSSPNLPRNAIEQVTTLLGGLPAQYGDATGGVISITTKGPQSIYTGGVEAISSQYLDPYGYNLLNFNVSGPILLRKDTTTKAKKSVLGFFLSGQVTQFKDGSPNALGVWKVKDNVLSDLEQKPLSAGSNGGFTRNAEHVTLNDLEKVKANQNAGAFGGLLSGKIDYKPTENLNITVGGAFEYDKGRSPAGGYILFNTVNNPEYINTTARGFARLTQRFNNATKEEEEKSPSNIKNAFYTLQAGYSRTKNISQDAVHKDKIFDYGYIGKFTQQQIPFYAYQTGSNGDGFYQVANYKNQLDFSPGTKNTTAVKYTQQYYDFVDNKVESENDFVQFAPYNGYAVQNVYGMWNNTGTQNGGYSVSNTDLFTVSTAFSADIKNHAIEAGFQYEQRSYSNFGVSALGIWRRMTALANDHLSQLDTANPILNQTLSGAYNYWDYNRKYDATTQRQFDKSLREKLGKPLDGTEWIDVNALDPNTFSLSMFSAEDLVNETNTDVSFYGYDYTGKKLRGKPSLDDYFNKKDANGNFTRSIGSFDPIYVAGYIQDKFDFRDVKFNVGVRIDRYDANQKVIKDRYLLYDAKTSGEVSGSLNTKNGGVHPANVGSDYVVYVNDKLNPTSIVGYRNNSTWYNAQGAEIADPNLLAAATTSGKITPYLVNPSATKISSTIFKDYVPQVMVSPRIAFAFPVSDVANLFAHYDIVTQRPSPGLSRFDPAGYNYLENNVGATIANSDLKPEKSVNYELGFTQVLNERKNSAINISAFYIERRNQIQAINVNQAYPVRYVTYGNIDFSTVKGFSFAYDLRRTNNISINANYTLQFAEGTGSGANDNFNLVSTGNPNLRVAIPLSIDQRHAFKGNIDYRFASGKDYNGLVWVRHKGKENEKAIQVLSRVGANLTFNAGSGTPYSKRGISNAYAGVGRTALVGSINGSSLPWQYRFDLRLDKDFDITWGSKKDEEERKKTPVNVSITLLNVFNTLNVIGVYPATGDANDDGWLASAAGQTYASSQTNPQAYKDLYTASIQNGNNYSVPRRIRLGLIMNF